jgi:hypothetical protein
MVQRSTWFQPLNQTKCVISWFHNKQIAFRMQLVPLRHGDGLPRPAALVRRASATAPRPFSFERRESTRPMSISEVRLEQDLVGLVQVEVS